MFYSLSVGLQKNAAAAVAFEGTEGRARGRVRTKAFGVGPDRLRHTTVCGGGGGVFVLRR